MKPMSLDQDQQPSNVEGPLPAWAASVAARLAFFARDHRGRPFADHALMTTLAALHECTAAPADNNRVLQRFLRACLTLFAEAAGARSDLAGFHKELEALCDLARQALDSDCDDRRVNARAREFDDHRGAMCWVAHVPGRVVFLAAMAAQMPEEEGGAAVMLVNDLAAVDPDLPLRALQAALRD
jgi:hypothetical protein